MPAHFPLRFTLRTAVVVVLATFFTGCAHDPEKMVTIEIVGIDSKEDRESVTETLKKVTDGPWHYITSTSSGDTMTIRVSPVRDVDAYLEKIDFGKVTEVKGRTVKVEFVE